MTNKELLTNLTSEGFYDIWKSVWYKITVKELWLLKMFNRDEKTAMIEWLNSEKFADIRIPETKEAKDKTMTNREWLATLSAEEFYDVWYKVLTDYGRNYIDTRLAMIEWLDREHNPDRLF